MSEMIILQCAGCEAFQVHNKRSQTYTAKGNTKPIKWQCKICGVKQSLQKIFFQGTSKECRINVQHLNMQRATAPQSFRTQEPGFDYSQDESMEKNLFEEDDHIYKKPRLDDMDTWENTYQEYQENDFSKSIFSELFNDDSNDGENDCSENTFQNSIDEPTEKNLPQEHIHKKPRLDNTDICENTYQESQENEEKSQENDFSNNILSELFNDAENDCSKNTLPSSIDKTSAKKMPSSPVDSSKKLSLKTSIFENEDDDVNDLLDF